jgi:hypothetical protein
MTRTKIPAKLRRRDRGNATIASPTIATNAHSMAYPRNKDRVSEQGRRSLVHPRLISEPQVAPGGASRSGGVGMTCTTKLTASAIKPHKATPQRRSSDTRQSCPRPSQPTGIVRSALSPARAFGTFRLPQSVLKTPPVTKPVRHKPRRSRAGRHLRPSPDRPSGETAAKSRWAATSRRPVAIALVAQRARARPTWSQPQR